MHSITKCRGCGIVLTQCRCPSPNKTVKWGECSNRAACRARYPRTEPVLTTEEPSYVAPIVDLAIAVVDAVSDWAPSDSGSSDTSFDPGGGDGGGGGASVDW